MYKLGMTLWWGVIALCVAVLAFNLWRLWRI